MPILHNVHSCKLRPGKYLLPGLVVLSFSAILLFTSSCSGIFTKSCIYKNKITGDQCLIRYPATWNKDDSPENSCFLIDRNIIIYLLSFYSGKRNQTTLDELKKTITGTLLKKGYLFISQDQFAHEAYHGFLITMQQQNLIWEVYFLKKDDFILSFGLAYTQGAFAQRDDKQTIIKRFLSGLSSR